MRRSPTDFERQRALWVKPARVGTLWREIAGAPPKEGAALGSVALDSAGPESDVDLLVEFEKPVGLLQFVRLQIQLAANRSLAAMLIW
jgi:hypothetical protein